METTFVDALLKVEKTILSCKTHEQFNSAHNMVLNLMPQYKNILPKDMVRGTCIALESLVILLKNKITEDV